MKNIFLSNLYCLCFLLLPFIMQATARDTSKVFTETAYLDWVKAYHPIMQQARLLNRVGNAYMQKAKGGFDPKIFGEIERKSFDGKTYFTIGDTGFKLPSWLGAEFKAGYNWANGNFLNPENNLPNTGQAYIGVKWTLGRGLAIDERRATLRKAKIIQKATDAERQSIINNLLLDAGKAYWNWVNAYNNWQILEGALELAEIRFLGVKNSFLLGDKPAIDTLESLIQVQNRQIVANEMKVAYENATRNLSNFLWYQNELPVELSSLLKAPFYAAIDLEKPVSSIASVLTNLSETHPDLQQIWFKLEKLEIDKQAKKEQLKPQLDVSFNFLADGWDFINPPTVENINNINVLLTENYKVGVKVGMPLFLRKERGDLELVNIKLLETKLKIRQKTQEIKNKILNYEEQLDNNRQQIRINETVITNYEQLLTAENDKFRFGESSIFLLNSREQKLVAAQLKLVKLTVNYQKSRLALMWAMGYLNIN